MISPPRISIVVPARNAAGTLDACLRALRAQTGLRAPPEILVVDDGSADETARIALRHAPEVRLLRQPPLGAAAARNHGAFEARGDLLLFTDADCRPLPDWAARMSEAFTDPGVAGVKGFFQSDQAGLLPRLVQVEYEEKEARMLSQARVVFADTAAAGYRSAIFREAGGFKADMQAVEDTELAFRLAAAGHRIVLAPQALVLHEHPRRWRDYAARKLRYGIWGAHAYLAYPERLRDDSRTPQTMRAQLLLAPAIVLLGLGSLAWPPLLPLLATACAAFLVSSLPFALRAGAEGWPLGLAAPPLVFLRGLALAGGLAVGIAGRLLGERRALPRPAGAAPKPGLSASPNASPRPNVPGGEA